MSSNLLTRLGKLEVTAGVSSKIIPRIVRLVANEGEEQEVYRQAAEMGLDVSPESKDLLIIRLICRPDGTKPPRRNPERAAIEHEHVAALIAAVDGKTRSV